MRVWTSWCTSGGLAALVVMAAWHGGPSRMSAAPQAPASEAEAKRVVAYIHNTIPLTRDELGEYLIARLGADRIQSFVNLRIIEHACQQKGIDVTAAEVEAGLAEDLKGLNVNRKEFVDRILKHYRKTLYEWKFDVIRPRLLMAKLCRDRVQCTEEDLKMAFEAYYGEKVDCRLILWPKEMKTHVFSKYATLRDSDEAFDEEAKKQASPTLAASGGRIAPIGRHTTGNEELEKAAFSLKPGELSHIMDTPEGICVLKCVKRIPPDTTVKLADVRDKLEKEVIEKKIQLEIPKLFKELQDQAQPKIFLKEATGPDELLRDVRQELQQLGPGVGKNATPKGN